MKDVIEIVKFFEDSGLLLKGVGNTILSQAKEQKAGFLSMLLGTLGASLLENILARKRAIAKSVSEEIKSKRQGRGINRVREGTLKASYENKKVRKTTTKNKVNF